MTVNLHIRTVEQSKAIKDVKLKITDIDAMKIQEQRKAVRAGYDMDIIPSDISTFGVGAKQILQDLQNSNERMFLITILIMHTAPTRQKLNNAIYHTESLLQQHNCSLKRLDFQQEAGLMSSVPIGIYQIEIERGITTTATAGFMPFYTRELFEGGEALYYGLNAKSHNMIMVDRKKLKNPKGVYGTGPSQRSVCNRDTPKTTGSQTADGTGTRERTRQGDFYGRISQTAEYGRGTDPMSAVAADRTIKRTDKQLHITKRIGSTTYKVSVHFSRTSREAMSDKLVCLIERGAVKQ